MTWAGPRTAEGVRQAGPQRLWHVRQLETDTEGVPGRSPPPSTVRHSGFHLRLRAAHENLEAQARARRQGDSGLDLQPEGADVQQTRAHDGHGLGQIVGDAADGAATLDAAGAGGASPHGTSRTTR
jgi:hypothetical protein